MESVHLRLIDLEHRILRTIVAEVVSTIREPTIQNRLMPIMIVCHSDNKLVFDPHQQVFELKADASKA
jgi:hypothetical protein